MKKMLPLIFLVVFAWSCEKESLMSELTLDQILNGKEVAVHKGMLNFKDQASFDSFVKSRVDLSATELEQWEKANNFKSLSTIHEEIIDKEDVFLNTMNIKYNGSESITRKDIGYTPEAQALIDKGLLVVNEYETLDLNVPVHFYGGLLNKDGILRIGNEIHVPKMDFIMVIKDGDIRKIDKAKTYKPGDPQEAGILIAQVERRIASTNTANSKVAVVSSCDQVSGSYRLIVYDEYSFIYYLDGSYPCDNTYSSYSIKLRSLKKILGTWQNHNTSQWRLTSNLVADHWRKCYYTTGTPYFDFLRNIVTYNNRIWAPPFGNTWVQPLYANYRAGKCESGGSGSCLDGSDPEGVIRFPFRQHWATGINATSCYVGE